MWGWEAAERTVHTYVGGLLVESVTTREPEFDTHQRELLLASAAFEASVGSHGFPMSEATSSDADPANSKATARFEASKFPIVDYAEKARKDAMEAYEKKYPDANKNGHVWPVSRVEF